MRKEKREKIEKKKMDKFSILRKILAAFLIAFTVLGTCHTFIYLIVNA